MARVIGNVLTQGWSGKLGPVVFRRRGKNTYVVMAPDFSNRVLSARQQEQVSKFRQAVAYAQGVLQSPELKRKYERRVDLTGSVYHRAIKDFMLGLKKVDDNRESSAVRKEFVPQELTPLALSNMVKSDRPPTKFAVNETFWPP